MKGQTRIFLVNSIISSESDNKIRSDEYEGQADPSDHPLRTDLESDHPCPVRFSTPDAIQIIKCTNTQPPTRGDFITES